MAATLYPILTEAVLFIETVEHMAEVRSALTAAGYNDGRHQAGLATIDRAMEVVDHAIEMQNDTSSVHLVHTAATDLEMWIQATCSRVRRCTNDAALASSVSGADIHFRDHPVSVMAAAQRLLTVLRNDEELRRQLGSARAVDDVLQRGNVLLRKVWRVAEDLVRPEHTNAAQLIVPAAAEVEAWNTVARDLATCAHAGDPRRLGFIGVLAEGAAPMGGTAGSVIRHAQSSRTPPTGGPAPGTSGWTIGRQGRNAENRGEGYGPS
jgi:hypothetical protein